MESSSTIDEMAATVTRTVRVAAPRDLVFAVLTEPSQIAQWFGQTANFPDGMHAGSEGCFGWFDHSDFPARVETYEPPSRFAFTWGRPGEAIRADNSTLASFTLEDDGDHTLLTVVESGFDQLGDLAHCRAAMTENAQGWTDELDELVRHADRLTTGTGLRPKADLDRCTITRSVLVRAPQQTTWATLTDPAAIEHWWGHPAVFPGGIRSGAEGTFEWVGHGLMPILVERFDAPTAFDLRWGDLGDKSPGDNASLIEFRLSPVAEHTLLTVVEHGFTHLNTAERRAAMGENVTGWTKVVDALVHMAESVA